MFYTFGLRKFLNPGNTLVLSSHEVKDEDKSTFVGSDARCKLPIKILKLGGVHISS